ncbi:hypothetical protein ACQP0U_21955 [Micromonospora sp. CA-269861]|uniref:hypothetical protein n=1 Tax=Micromonospora sp. CA-269861 TaxID=3239968 RepID=UPI003D93653A
MAGTYTLTDTDLLDLLIAHDATAIVAPAAAEWRALAATYDTVGRLDAASAVLAPQSRHLDLCRPAGALGRACRRRTVHRAAAGVTRAPTSSQVRPSVVPRVNLKR